MAGTDEAAQEHDDKAREGAVLPSTPQDITPASPPALPPSTTDDPPASATDSSSDPAAPKAATTDADQLPEAQATTADAPARRRREPPTERTAFGDVVTSSPKPASPSSSLLPSSSSPTLAASEAATAAGLQPPPPPLRRPPPPKKGILKPAKTPSRGLLGGLIRPSLPQLAQASPSSTAARREAASGSQPIAAREVAAGVGGAVQHGGERAGAFLSKAFGKLSSVASGIASGTVPSPSTAAAAPPVPPKPSSSSSADPGSTSAASAAVAPASPSSAARLKRVTFPLSHAQIIYPISSLAAPYSEATTSQISVIESAYEEKRKDEEGAEWWTERRVGEAFEGALRGREEGVDERVLRAVKAAAPPPPAPRTLSLSHIPLTHFTLAALSDLLTLPLALQKLDLSSTNLNEGGLKVVLWALLVSGELHALVLRDNRRLKLPAWRTLAEFLQDPRASSVSFLDVSENPWERRAVEALVKAFKTGEEGGKEKGETRGGDGLETLRMDGCVLRGGALEALAQGIRSSTIRHLSLRNNRIPSLGGVSLAVMIKDYPDVTPSSGASPFAQPLGYSAYIPRSRREPPPAAARADHVEDLPQIPSVQSNATGGVTRRVVPEGYRRPGMDSSDESDDDGAGGPPVPEKEKVAADPVGRMMATRVRALDDVQRLGRLVTLDLKSNDLRTGVTYIAQVLKRNRTLKVLNLAENRLDVDGLVALAEALKYNSTLDTLDLSHNAVCGPSLEGIHALRHAFTLNANLKRLFLSSTSLNTSGAIALAEFLPEATHLLHLDLTENPAVETAGVMALAVGLRSNRIVRCLDLTVGMGDEEGAGLSRDILQSCIRNTELAQDKTQTKAARLAVWAPIQKSTLARQAKEADSAAAVAAAVSSSLTPAGQARAAVFELAPEEVEREAEEAVQSLTEGVDVRDALGVIVAADLQGVIERARVLRERLEETVQQLVNDPEGADRLQVLLGLVDRLTTATDKAELALAQAALRAREENAAQARTPAPAELGLAPPPVATGTPTRKSGRSSADSLTSPNFSIADSSDEDDDDGSDDDDDDGAIDLLAPASGGTSPDSPTGRKSLRWVEEEGEVFRKGVVLGAADVDDADEGGKAEVSGEQLKEELLHTDVERQSPRRLSIDETFAVADPDEETI